MNTQNMLTLVTHLHLTGMRSSS